MTCVRSLLVALVPVSLVSGCGAGGQEEGVHQLPGYDISFSLPSSWRAVDHESSDAELDRFQRDHPRFLEIGEILRLEDANRFAAATEQGRVRLLVTARPADPGYTLRGHIEQNLPPDEGKTRAQFQQEFGDVLHQRAFDLPFLRLLAKAEEIETIGVLERLPRQIGLWLWQS
jgi:hypothetical protein